MHMVIQFQSFACRILLIFQEIQKYHFRLKRYSLRASLSPDFLKNPKSYTAKVFWKNQFFRRREKKKINK